MQRLSVVVAVTAVVLAGLFVLPSPAFAAPPPAGGTEVVDEDFSGATVPDPAWTGQGDTCLTGAAAGSTPGAAIANCSARRSGPVPAIGVTPGYLQLTDTRTNSTGTILYNRPIPASAGLSVVFEQYQYGGTGADGIGFFLVDGATNLTKTGGNGGSLGYAQRTDQDGILGGYVGVGLDAYGNFYDDGEGRGASCPVGQRSPSSQTGAVAPNVITIRGPGSGRSGYCFQGATTDPASNANSPTSTLPGTLRAPAGTTNPAVAKRLVNVQVTPAPNPLVIVQVDFGTGNGWQTVLQRAAPANPPSTYKFGFSSATGGSTDVHLLRNVVVRTINKLDALQITKQVDRTGAALPAVITAGTRIPYSYVVTNAGLETVNTLAVADDKITGPIVCAATTLPPAPDPAATTVCRGGYTVIAADVGAGAVTNSAQARAVDPGGDTVNSNQDTATVPLVSALQLTKTVATGGPYYVGQRVGYRYVVTNTGGSTVSNIAVADNRTAAGTVICDRSNLDPGEQASCALTTPIDASQLAADGSLTNTARATGSTPIGQQVISNQAIATIAVGTDVAVTKTVDDKRPTVGERVTFTVTAANLGPGGAQNAVVNDLLPTALTLVSATPTSGSYNPATGDWSIPTLPLGSPPQPATLTIVATVDNSGAITNAATLTALRQPDTNPDNNSASVTINPVVPTADIAVTKSVDSPSVRVGQKATFTLTAHNNGPFPATGVTVRDVLPGRLQFVTADPGYDPATGIWTVGSLRVGDTATLRITVLATAVGSFQNTAGLAAVSPQDLNQANDVDSATLLVTPPQADLQIVKSIVSGTTGIQVGDTVTYSVVVTNAGPDPVPDVRVEDTPIPGLTVLSTTPSQGAVDQSSRTWTVGALEPGDSASLFVNARVDTEGTKDNEATVSSATVDDPRLSNNTAAASLTAAPTQIDLAVAKTRTGPATVPLGASVSFTVAVTNHGPADATNVVLFDQLPAGLTYESSNPEAGSYDPSTGRWTVGTIPTGATRTLTITATATDVGEQQNTAELQSLDQADTDEANNRAAATVTVVALADLGITKTVTPAVAQPGQMARYTITVTNHGPQTAEAIQVVDPYRTSLVIVGTAASQGTLPTGSASWNVGTLAPGATATLTVDTKVGQLSPLLNTVVITQSSLPDPDLSNNRAQAVLQVPAADLAVGKTVDNAHPTVGQRVVYTVTATNHGPDPTTSARVTDLLPAGLRFVSAAATAGRYQSGTGVWSIGDLTPGGPSVRLTIVAIAQQPGRLTNTAHITATFPYDPNPANNSAGVGITVAAAPADLSIAKTVAPQQITPGGRAVFSIAVTNHGPGAATGVIVTDTLPPGLAAAAGASAGCTTSGQAVTCTVDTLAAGSNVTLTIPVTGTVAGHVTNTAHVSAHSTDPNPANNTAGVALTITAATTTAISPPTSTPPSPPGGGASPPVPGGQLPNTGVAVLPQLVLAGLLLLLGAILTYPGRTRRRSGSPTPSE